ncbi:MAG: carbohydrate ABC transporter permease [Candidatus Odinarchaeota archaeon]
MEAVKAEELPQVRDSGFKHWFRDLFGGKEAGFITAMLTPAGIIFFLGIFFPLVYGLIVSFFFITRTEVEFVGLTNYIDMLLHDPDFSRFYWNTVIFTVITVFAELIIGLVIALILNKSFTGRGVVRASILVPWAIPTIVNALLWSSMFRADMVGLINDMLWRIGVIERTEPIVFAGGGLNVPLNIPWLVALFTFPVTLFVIVYAWLPKIIYKTFDFKETAEIISAILLILSAIMLFVIPQEWLLPGGLLSIFTVEFPTDFIVVFIVDIWKTTPFMALLILAGLQVIPQDLYKASEVDGASKWQQFRHVTLPILLPGIGTALIFRTIDAFRVYDIFEVFSATRIASITKYAVYQHRFGYYGSASAIAIFEFVNIVLFTVFFMYVTRRRVD